jgi:hypothetical protein
VSADIDPACDCPTCPECGLPCGTIDESEPLEDWLVCGACGAEWEGSSGELAQARRADAAYEAKCEAEERDALTFEAMPAALREANRRMLKQLEARRQAPECEQLSLLGGEP